MFIKRGYIYISVKAKIYKKINVETHSVERDKRGREKTMQHNWREKQKAQKIYWE